MGAEIAIGAGESITFDRGWLAQLSSRAAEFSGAKPFPHIVIDDFLPAAWYSRVKAEIPEVAGQQMLGPQRGAERGKTARNQPEHFGLFTTALLWQLNASPFIEALEKLTSINSLIADMRLEGGGHHETVRGGRLAVHTDFGRHKVSNLRRRLNLIIYFNDDWEEGFGGHLELWDKELRACGAKVLPVANRCVIFETGADTFHGQPDLLTCPEDRARQSLALYYYDNPTEQRTTESRTTIYVARPGSPEQKPAKRLLHTLVPRSVRDRVIRLLT